MAFPPHESEAAQAPVGAGQCGPLLKTQRPKTAETDLMITGRHINSHLFKHLGSKGEVSVSVAANKTSNGLGPLEKQVPGHRPPFGKGCGPGHWRHSAICP